MISFIKKCFTLEQGKVLFLYVMDNHSFHPPFYGTYCAGEVCFSRPMEEGVFDYGFNDGGRSGSFSGQSGF